MLNLEFDSESQVNLKLELKIWTRIKVRIRIRIGNIFELKLDSELTLESGLELQVFLGISRISLVACVCQILDI